MTPLVRHLDNLMALNNQGCSDLERGDLGTAMGNFTTTLSAIKELLVRSCQPYQDSERGVSRPPLLPMHLHLLHSNAGSRSLAHASDGGQVYQTSEFTIYASAMRMLPGVRFLEDSVENSTIHASMVVFNLGLTLHLQGIGNCCRRSLEKAKALYSNTYQLVDPIIRECFKEGRPTENACFDLFVLALLNNIALINMEFAEYRRAEIAFQSLMAYATISSSFEMRSSSSFSSSYRHEDQNGEVEQRQFQNGNDIVLGSVASMLLNAMVFGFNIMPAAPAA